MAQDEDLDPAEAAFREMLARLDALDRKVAALPKGRLPPDYSDTLAEIIAGQKALAARLASFKLDTGAVVAEVRAAFDSAVAPTLQEIRRATAGVEGSTRFFDQISAHIVTGRDLKAERNRWAACGVAIGVVAWMLAAGPLARVLPASWAVPEKMAAATLGTTRVKAGPRLIASVDPQGWNDMVAGIVLYRTNRSALDKCEQQAKASHASRVCSIRIEPPGRTRQHPADEANRDPS